MNNIHICVLLEETRFDRGTSDTSVVRFSWNINILMTYLGESDTLSQLSIKEIYR